MWTRWPPARIDLLKDRARLESSARRRPRPHESRFCAPLVVPHYVRYYEEVLGNAGTQAINESGFRYRTALLRLGASDFRGVGGERGRTSQPAPELAHQRYRFWRGFGRGVQQDLRFAPAARLDASTAMPTHWPAR